MRLIDPIRPLQLIAIYDRCVAPAPPFAARLEYCFSDGVFHSSITPRRFTAWTLIAVAVVGASSVSASAEGGTETAAEVSSVEAAPSNSASPLIHAKGRTFGIFPDSSAVDEAAQRVPPTTKQLFSITASHTFGPAIFSFLTLTAGFRNMPGADYQQRYLTAVADNAIGNFMTSAIAPALLHQDPRYVPSSRNGILFRAGYALSRTVATRSRSGRTQLNYSEIGGNVVAAGLSNLYDSRGDRILSATLTRWGSQILWNCMSNEMREFWPDVRRRLTRH